MLNKVVDYIPAFIWTADSQMNLKFISKTWLNFTKTEKKNLLGNKWLDRVHPEDRVKLVKKFKILYKKPDFFSIQFRFLHHSGKFRWVNLKGTAQIHNGKIRFIGGGNEIHNMVESDEAKNDFMNFASHEIKTPLTAIQLYLEIIERKLGKADSKELSRFIKNAQVSTRTLTGLINSFLDITSAQNGKIRIIKTKVEISEILKNIVRQSKLIFKSHKIKLGSVTPFNIVIDEKKIEEVIINLISNAVRYSPNGSVVTVSQTVGDKSVIIKVKDQGIGIPKSEHKKIFKKFYQLKRDPNKVVGLGMGLYIAQSIIRKHSGRIRVESTLNKGSTFIIELPFEDGKNKFSN